MPSIHALAIIAGTTTAAIAQTAPTLTVIATELSEPTPAGNLYRSFADPTLAEDGTVFARVGIGTSGGRISVACLVAPRTAPLELPIVEGTPVSGGGAILDISENIAVNTNNQAVFHASLFDTALANATGLFRLNTATNTITTLAREGDQTTLNGTLGRFEPSPNTDRFNTINANGNSAFVAGLLGPTAPDFAAFLATPSSNTPLTSEADPFPFTDNPDLPLEDISFVTINDNNQAAFVYEVFRNGTARGVYTIDTNGTRPLAVPGQTLPDERTFASARVTTAPPINNAGQVAFTANIEAISGVDPVALVRADNAGIDVLAQGGDTFPSVPFPIRSFDANVALNQNGTVAAKTFDNFFSENFLLVTNGSTATTLAVGGQPAPGGGTFQGFFDTWALNDNDQLAFLASVDIDGTTRDALFRHDPALGTTLVAREGQTLEGHTIDNIIFAGIGNGTPRLADADGLNNTGDIAFRIVDDAGLDSIVIATFSEPPCNPADLVDSFGILDLADVDAFITAFANQDPIADIATNFGVIDLADIDAFITNFLAGCP